jgi:hypothetical protein
MTRRAGPRPRPRGRQRRLLRAGAPGRAEPGASPGSRPERTKRQLRVAQGWIAGHARRLISVALLIAGSYMTLTGLIRLS